VAQGYLNRPEQNAERFLFHAFAGEQKQRLYKSGDLARYHANGDIEYIGRNDAQVKIRGFRVEPAEIELRLLTHHALKQCCAIARQTKSRETGLVAFLVKKDQSSELSARELRDFLAALLPIYMVPVAFVFLDTLPLTRNGKLDRRSL